MESGASFFFSFPPNASDFEAHAYTGNPGMTPRKSAFCNLGERLFFKGNCSGTCTTFDDEITEGCTPEAFPSLEN